MKRSPMPKRRVLLESSRTPLPKVNDKRQAKRRKAYNQKLAAYKRSATYRIVEERAGGQCEAIVRPEPGSTTKFAPFRCGCSRANGDRLTHDHKRYGRQFGGNERPEDVEVLCDWHNARAESLHPTRTRDYRRPRTSDPL